MPVEATAFFLQLLIRTLRVVEPSLTFFIMGLRKPVRTQDQLTAALEPFIGLDRRPVWFDQYCGMHIGSCASRNAVLAFFDVCPITPIQTHCGARVANRQILTLSREKLQFIVADRGPRHTPVGSVSLALLLDSAAHGG